MRDILRRLLREWLGVISPLPPDQNAPVERRLRMLEDSLDVLEERVERIDAQVKEFVGVKGYQSGNW